MTTDARFEDGRQADARQIERTDDAREIAGATRHSLKTDIRTLNCAIDVANTAFWDAKAV